MKDRLQKLLTVKSIVTILLTVLFVVLAMTNRISGMEVLTIYTMIISFYFGTQYEKKGADVANGAETCVDAATCPYKIEPKNEVVEV
jgi:hypothetical protein